MSASLTMAVSRPSKLDHRPLLLFFYSCLFRLIGGVVPSIGVPDSTLFLGQPWSKIGFPWLPWLLGAKLGPTLSQAWRPVSSFVPAGIVSRDPQHFKSSEAQLRYYYRDGCFARQSICLLGHFP